MCGLARWVLPFPSYKPRRIFYIRRASNPKSLLLPSLPVQVSLKEKILWLTFLLFPSTTSNPPTFIFLGGDCAHHGGEFRPSPTLPFPSVISPSPLPRLHPTVCPGSLFIPIHRLYEPSARATATDVPTSQPFFETSATGAHDVEQCQDSVRKMSAFDGRDDVLVIIAHDAHMLDVVTFFPHGTANSWKAEGWKEKGAWKFLGDFEQAVKEREEVGRG